MPNIRPLSDMRNYGTVLQEVSDGCPLFLTKNGRGKYAVLDMQDYERMQALLKLAEELDKGRQSGERAGWQSTEDVKARLSERRRTADAS